MATTTAAAAAPPSALGPDAPRPVTDYDVATYLRVKRIVESQQGIVAAAAAPSQLPPKEEKTTWAKSIKNHKEFHRLGRCGGPVMWCCKNSEKALCGCISCAGYCWTLFTYLAMFGAAMLAYMFFYYYFQSGVQWTGEMGMSAMRKVVEAQVRAEMAAKSTGADDAAVKQAWQRHSASATTSPQPTGKDEWPPFPPPS